MARDQRIISRETEFAVQGIKKISCKPNYKAVLIEGGATPKDMAYLAAYNSLCKADPALAQVIAEAYFFGEGMKQDSKYQELQRQKEEAVTNQDFGLAAELRDKADALKGRVVHLPKLLEEFAQKLSSIARGLEEVTGGK